MNQVNRQLDGQWWVFDEDTDIGDTIRESIADGQTALRVTTKNRQRIKRVGLVVRCQELARFLRGFGEDPWADWVESCVADIRAGNPKAISKILGGFAGCAGITEVYLCPEAGHRLHAADEARVNEQFLFMLGKVNELARAVRSGNRFL